MAFTFGRLFQLTADTHKWKSRVTARRSDARIITPDETTRVAALLREAIDAGAFGFSTTTLPQHIGYQGRPLACRLASTDELKAFVQALPLSLIARVLRNPSPQADGLQALLAIEKARREERCGDFHLSRDLVDDKLVVTFNPPETGGHPLSFKLDERFQLDRE